jgi:Polyketide cyclase / dehydrase and lipid transport
MPHVVVDLDTDVPAERVLAAATDFSEERPELWPNISREFWQLHDRGPDWAEATEGSPAVWARERYEWSGRRVVGTTQDSNVWRPGGTWDLTVEPRNGGGSHIHLAFDRRFKGRGWLFYPLVALFGRRVFERNLRKTLDVLARRGGNRRPGAEG